jgi:uncharacterized protein (TIRG00374 family)
MQYKSIFGLLISATLILFLAISVEWGPVWLSIRQMDLLPIIPAFVLIIVQFIVRSWRWRLLLPAQQQYSTKKLFDSIMVGNLANFILPMRAGELIRPFLLSSYYPALSFGSGLVSVVVERFFDLAIVLALFSIAALLNSNLPVEVMYGAYFFSILAVSLLAFMIFGCFCKDTILKLLSYFFNFLPTKLSQTLLKFSDEFLGGAALVLRSPKRALLVLFASMTIWLLTALLTLVFFWFFNIYPGIEIAIATTVIVALAVASPSAPGFLGVYQWACLASFSLYSLPQDKAVAYSIISHLFNYIIFVAFGGWVLWRDGLKLFDLAKEANKGGR